MTLLFTDVEGSTELLERLRERYADLLAELRQLLRRATREAGGTEIDSRADEYFAVIPDASAAVRAAVSVQRQLEDLGRYRLKGIPRPVRLYQLSADGMEVEFGPLRAEPVSA